MYEGCYLNNLFLTVYQLAYLMIVENNDDVMIMNIDIVWVTLYMHKDEQQ